MKHSMIKDIDDFETGLFAQDTLGKVNNCFYNFVPREFYKQSDSSAHYDSYDNTEYIDTYYRKTFYDLSGLKLCRATIEKNDNLHKSHQFAICKTICLSHKLICLCGLQSNININFVSRSSNGGCDSETYIFFKIQSILIIKSNFKL